MTKKEQAEMDKLRSELGIVLALRWSGYVDPEKEPAPQQGYVNGWYANTYAANIEPAWSESVSHGIGRHRTGGRSPGEPDAGLTGSQNGCRLYRTKRDALIGLRLAKEREFAGVLARIDALIADAAP